MRNIAEIAAQVMPPADHQDRTWKEKGNTGDIIQAILSAEKYNQTQTAGLAPHLQGNTTRETLRNVWFFVRNQIQYVKDSPGHERVKLPAKTWADRTGDCKSMSVFVAGLLKNLGIPAKYRFTSYIKGGPVTHVYLVAMPKGEKEYILDAVHTRFDSEEPYKSKKEYPIMTKVSVVHGLSSGTNNRTDDKPRKLAPWKPIAWGKLTEGEYRMALVAQQIEIVKDWYGDPSGKLEASIEAINNTLYAGVHRIGAVNVASNVLPDVVKLIRTAKTLIQPAGQVYSSFRDPRKEGLIPDYIGIMSDDEFKKFSEDLIASGECAEEFNYSKEALNHPGLFFGNLANAKTLEIAKRTDLGKAHKIKLIRECRNQAEIYKVFNKQLVPGSSYVLYNFNQNTSVAPARVETKTILHKASRDVLGPRISGLSKTNMDLFLRNGIMHSSADQTNGELDPTPPEELIKILIAGNQEGIGFEPLSTAAIVTLAIKFLVAAATAMGALAALLPPKDQVALNTIQGFGTDALTPDVSDWNGYNPKTNDKGQLINDPTKAGASWLLPVLIGGGLLWGANKLK